MTNTITLPRSVVEQALEDLEMTINYVQSPTRREDMCDSIEALRAALEQPQDHHEQHLDMVPAGWKLVPVEPTKDMKTAGAFAAMDQVRRSYNPPSVYIPVDSMALLSYRAMLAAAPQPPALEQPQGEQEPVACSKDPRGCWSVRCQLGGCARTPHTGRGSVLPTPTRSSSASR